nr:MAG TPA: hypothetical protein [Caudoviricetes sp.]
MKKPKIYHFKVIKCGTVWASVGQAKLPQDRINTGAWDCGTCGIGNTPSINFKIDTQL